MGRRQTMMEKYKQQMKAYKKKKMKVDNTPYLPSNETVYIMDSMDPKEKLEAEVIKTRIKNHREIIETIACPVCVKAIKWDELWEAFICVKHGKAIYEIVSKN